MSIPTSFRSENLCAPSLSAADIAIEATPASLFGRALLVFPLPYLESYGKEGIESLPITAGRLSMEVLEPVALSETIALHLNLWQLMHEDMAPLQKRATWC